MHKCLCVCVCVYAYTIHGYRRERRCLSLTVTTVIENHGGMGAELGCKAKQSSNKMWASVSVGVNVGRSSDSGSIA